MEQSRFVANEAAKRMPSIPNKYVKSPKAKGSPIWGIVQDLRNNGVTLSASCTGQAVEKARESYLSQVVNGNLDSPPCFDEGFVSLHNRYDIGRFFEKDGTFYVELKPFPYEKIVLPFLPGDYQDFFLERLVKGELDHGAGEICKYPHGFSLNLSVKKQVPDPSYDPETFIGVDLGLNVLAWAVAQNVEGEFLGETHFDGAEAGHVRQKFLEHRRELQRKGHVKQVEELKDRERRWMENKNHVVSRRIVEFAEKFDDPVIVLEEIDGNQLRRNVDDAKIHSWTMGELRDMVQYKAEEKGVKTETVNPRNTSQRCPDCGHIEKKNRDGLKFECVECGYENHADFVGAVNIGFSRSIL